MSDEPGKRRRQIWLAGLGVLFAYVAINILAINYVPLLHRLELDVSVVDAGSRSPVPDAAVSWLYPGPSGRNKSDPAGTTGPSGRAHVVRVIQDQPTWAFPQVGSLHLGELSLGISAIGYNDSQQALAELLPKIPYSDPRAEITIQLHRDAERR